MRGEVKLDRLLIALTEIINNIEINLPKNILQIWQK